MPDGIVFGTFLYLLLTLRGFAAHYHDKVNALRIKPSKHGIKLINRISQLD